MLLLSFLLSLALAGLVAAQNQTIDVNVGGVQSRGENIFMFSPNMINASVGDVIRFNFSGSPGNHSITQSTFQNPCQPMSGGFDSGWVFIPENGLPPDSDPIWNLSITNTSTPIWFFCKQLVPMPHCTTGMVGAINAPTSGDNTFQNYVSNAQKDTSPGQGIGGLIGNGASASAIPGPIDTSLGANYAGTPASTPVSASGGASPTSGGGTSGSGSNAASQLRMDAMLYLGAIAAVGLLA